MTCQKNSIPPKQIDALLPQTQCGLCTFNGCMPYAEALAEQKAEINLCPPGGVKGLLALAELLNKDATPFLVEMEMKTKPASYAVIREEECIGCTKCIQACPVDAILGTGKWMHTVIRDECTGCELCIAPCPVDCIDMVPAIQPASTTISEHYRKRYQAREKRLQNHPLKADRSSEQSLNNMNAKKYMADALERIRHKKNPS
jgi:electron transport complex protein RnfB